MQNVALLQIPKLGLLGMVSVASTCLRAHEESLDAFGTFLDVSGSSLYPAFFFQNCSDFVALVRQVSLALVPVPVLEALVLEQLRSPRQW